MSLIADLLAKANRKEQSGDIPPGLRRVVQESEQKQVLRKRILIVSVLFLGAVITGMAVLWAVNSLMTPAVPVQPSRIAQPPGAAPAPSSLPAQPPAAPPGISSDAPAPAQSPVASPQQDTPGSPKTDAERPVKPEPVEKKPAAEPSSVPGARAAGEKTSSPKPAAGTEPSRNPRAERDMYLYQGNAYESSGNYREALAAYRKAFELDRKNYIVLNNMSGMLIRQGSFAEAVSYARQALDLRGDYVPAMVNLGIAYMQGGKPTEAELTLRKALSLDSGNRSILLNLGILSERSHQYEQALQWYTRLAELRDVQGMLGLARIAERQGKRADAIRYYQEIAGTNPDAAVQRLINERLSVLGE